jgi:hypothetical protein
MTTEQLGSSTEAFLFLRLTQEIEVSTPVLGKGETSQGIVAPAVTVDVMAPNRGS